MKSGWIFFSVYSIDHCIKPYFKSFYLDRMASKLTIICTQNVKVSFVYSYKLLFNNKKIHLLLIPFKLRYFPIHVFLYRYGARHVKEINTLQSSNGHNHQALLNNLSYLCITITMYHRLDQNIHTYYITDMIYKIDRRMWIMFILHLSFKRLKKKKPLNLNI